MLNFNIVNDGIQECQGKPDIFVSNNDLQRIVENKDLRESIQRRFGRNVSIGILGEEVSTGCFKEEYNAIQDPAVPVEGLDFYEKLNT